MRFRATLRRKLALDANKVLKDAWTAVKDSGVPPELYEAAFNRAVDLMTGSFAQPPITAPTPPGQQAPRALPPSSGTATPTPPPLGQSPNDDDTFWNKLATETEVPRDRLEDIVHLDDGVPKMGITSKRLPNGKKGGQLFIAGVILTARHVWLGETETPLAEVRAECERYGVMDGNFAKHMKDMDEPGLTLTGSGRSAKARVRKNYVSGLGEFLDKSLSE
jgi:hypothetical protein